MRRLVGCVALAMILATGPVAAEDAGEQAAAAAAALSATVRLSQAAVAPAPAAATAPAPALAGPVALNALPLLEQLPPPPPPPPPITLLLKADLGSQRLTVIENGKERHVWPISSGTAGYATKTGTFHPQWASRMWRSRQYGYAPMPYAVFFHRGTAFHGTAATGLLGRPASHGCIRLATGNAAQLFKLVHKHGYAQTKIVVQNGSRGRAMAARDGARGKKATAQPTRRRDSRMSRYGSGPSPSWFD
jgi:L,D-transpeptidase-like protein